VEGSFTDLVSGERRPVRDVLRERAAQIGCSCVEPLISRNGAMRQREVGLGRVARWLVDSFLV
jgi:hypothetical protein